MCVFHLEANWRCHSYHMPHCRRQRLLPGDGLSTCNLFAHLASAPNVDGLRCHLMNRKPLSLFIQRHIRHQLLFLLPARVLLGAERRVSYKSAFNSNKRLAAAQNSCFIISLFGWCYCGDYQRANLKSVCLFHT